MKQPIVIDTDNTFGVPGRPIDDGQAILYAMGRDDLEILGMTTTHGNSNVDVVQEATEWLVSHSTHPDIKVYQGARGAGDYDTRAATYLAQIVDRHPGEISLVAIGTTTNLRGAAMIDPRFYGKLKKIVCMGGYRYRLPVQGWNKIAEVNLSRDYQASYSMLYGECPLVLFDAHICLQVPFGLRQLRPWFEFDRRAYYVQLDYLLAHIKELTEPVDYLWDLMPMVYLSCPDLFNERKVGLASTEEDLKTGTLRLEKPTPDHERIINAPDHIIDIDRCYDVMYRAWEKSPLLFQ